MAIHNIVIKKRTASFNVDSLNRTAVFTADVDNGCVAVLEAYSETPGEGIVWTAKQATATDKGLWMATSPEVVITRALDADEVAGMPAIDMKGVINDPRAFYNIKGHMVDMTYLNVGDIIEMTCAGIQKSSGGAYDGTDAYLVADTANFKLKGAAAAGTGMALRKIGTSKLHIGNAALVKNGVTTYKFVVEAN